MNLDLILGILQIVLIATTPLVFAGIGELVTEKSGALNLGVEGMMLVGAVSAFIILVITGSYFLAFFVSLKSKADFLGNSKGCPPGVLFKKFLSFLKFCL